MGHRRQSEEVLDRVLKTGKIAHRIHSASSFLAEEPWRDARGSLRQYRELVGEDGEVVDTFDGVQVALLPRVLLGLIMPLGL